MECKFKRGLDQIFVDRLNKEYNKDGWWKKIADHPKLTIAIRNNDLNVYYHGNSILSPNIPINFWRNKCQILFHKTSPQNGHA